MESDITLDTMPDTAFEIYRLCFLLFAGLNFTKTYI